MGARRRTFTDEQLVRAWATVDGISAIAEALGTTRVLVASRASHLRRHGVPMRPMGPVSARISAAARRPRGPRPSPGDPDEVRELVTRYREWVEAFRNRSG